MNNCVMAITCMKDTGLVEMAYTQFPLGGLDVSSSRVVMSKVKFKKDIGFNMHLQ